MGFLIGFFVYVIMMSAVMFPIRDMITDPVSKDMGPIRFRMYPLWVYVIFAPVVLLAIIFNLLWMLLVVELWK